MIKRNSGSAGRTYHALGGVFVVALVLLPVANAIGEPRRSGLLPLSIADAVTTAVLVASGVLCVICGLLERRELRLPLPAVLFALLYIFLSLRFLVAGEVTQVRNTVMILAAGLIVAELSLRGIDVMRAAQFAFRVATALGLALLVLQPAWFFNASEFFVDSGKLIAGLPNSQGLLSHPNYSGMYFGVGVILEVVRFRRRHYVVDGLFLASMAAMLFLTQARAALLGTALGVALLLLHHRGYFRSAQLALGATLLVAMAPVLLMLPYFLFGRSPDFSLLSALGTRQNLWTGVAHVLPRDPLIGQASAGIERARSEVTSSDVLFVTHAHNEMLTLLLVGGVLAGGIFVFFAISVIRSVKAPASGPLAGLAAAFLAQCATESPLGDFLPQAGTVLTCLLIAAIADKDRQSAPSWAVSSVRAQ